LFELVSDPCHDHDVEDAGCDQAPEHVVLLSDEAEDAGDQVASGDDKNRQQHGDSLNGDLFRLRLSPNITDVSDCKNIANEYKALSDQHRVDAIIEDGVPGKVHHKTSLNETKNDVEHFHQLVLWVLEYHQY
jgi:hypothetical protein